MVGPEFALLFFAILLATLAILLWPRGGLVPRLQRLTRLDERVRLEDAIKHIYTCQSTGHTCSLDSPRAIENYRARGFKLCDEETSLKSIPPTPPGEVGW